jgi:molecular chaperone GrpE
METTEVPPGVVAKVFSRGYMIGPRLLRPAMVAVATAPAARPDGDGSPQS